jgi:parallel beta-helix repeat protein
VSNIDASEELIKLKLFLLLAFLLVCLTGTASAVNIPAGYVSDYSLNSAGTTYVLTGDILANTNAFSIAANYIVLDGNGHKIDCGLKGSGVGVKSNGKKNVTIKNAVIVQHDSGSLSHGIMIQNTANTKIINCTVKSVGGAGIYVTGSSAQVDRCSTTSVSGKSLYLNANNCSVTNCTAVSTSSYGLELSNAHNNRFMNCIARSGSSHGIDLTRSNNNYFLKCAGYSNTSHGIYLM